MKWIQKLVKSKNKSCAKKKKGQEGTNVLTCKPTTAPRAVQRGPKSDLLPILESERQGRIQA